VTDAWTQQIDGQPKGVVYIYAWVSNKGNAKSVKTRTEFKVGSTRLGFVDIDGIKPGKRIRVRMKWDARKPNGTYTIYVRADYGNVANKETNETNNVGKLTVRIKNKTVTDVKFEQTG
jgi:subtilase family serine protease